MKKKSVTKTTSANLTSLKKQFTLFIAGLYMVCAVYAVDSYFHQKKNSSPVQKPVTAVETLNKKEPIHIGKGFHEKEQTEKPQRVIIPRLNIDIPVVEAAIVDGSWEVASNAANHGVGSAYPGQKGNMVIFAHARVHLFLPLENIKENDDVYVLTDKKWYAYKVAVITAVAPEQTEVIAPTKDERVTLFTCTGFADEKRLIVVGKREQNLAIK